MGEELLGMLSDILPPLELEPLPLHLLPRSTPPKTKRKKKGDKKKRSSKRKSLNTEKPIVEKIDFIQQPYIDLVQLIAQPDLVLAECLGTNKNMASSASVTGRIVEKILFVRGGNLLMDFIERMIRNEVKNTTKGGTLFRSNTFTTSIISAYGREIGGDYLRQVLIPLLKYVNEKDYDVELDPSKCEYGPDGSVKEIDIEQNERNLMEYIDYFLEGIMKSIDIIPRDIRKICYWLKIYVQDVFPESVHTCIGGFFFLRFFGPAIFNPESYNILNVEKRRPFTMISKCLQNISNQQLFTENFMKGLDTYIETKFELVRDFFDLIPENDEKIEIIGVYNEIPADVITKPNYTKLVSVCKKELITLDRDEVNACVDYDLVKELETTLDSIEKIKECNAKISPSTKKSPSSPKKNKKENTEDKKKKDRTSTKKKRHRISFTSYK
eukprot:TRINITY_DN1077_c0_g1_i2.p1 TRINITY_DN1077_c0_g1~~TRINITY_DN1077_c0_g1_i2.p1  ORF type:complete len:440 (+),score=101.94 TRINITY_DN1077_c0_g1_i2:51-1370(+)